MPKIPVIGSGQMLRHLLGYGCRLVRVRGSHHRILNPANGRLTTLPIHSGIDLSKGLFAKILKDLDIDIADFLTFIKTQ